MKDGSSSLGSIRSTSVSFEDRLPILTTMSAVYFDADIANDMVTIPTYLSIEFSALSFILRTAVWLHTHGVHTCQSNQETQEEETNSRRGERV